MGNGCHRTDGTSSHSCNPPHHYFGVTFDLSLSLFSVLGTSFSLVERRSRPRNTEQNIGVALLEQTYVLYNFGLKYTSTLADIQ